MPSRRLEHADVVVRKRPKGRSLYRAFLLGSALVPPAVLAFVSSPAFANPAGGHVVAGHAAIAGAGRTLTVKQTSNRAIVDWHSFSIGKGETARFNLPSSSAAILNRVTGPQLSSLLGNLYSNGQVYLLNPNGVLVGPNGRVNTAGFIASNLNISNQKFMQGGAQTLKGDSTAGITVLGTVKANGGDVLLVAAQVNNQGRIVAPDGRAVLAAGSEVFYVPGEDGNIIIAAPTPAPVNGAAVNNEGLIQAASVQLAAAGSAYTLAVNNGGQIQARAVKSVGGHIVLDGGVGDVTESGAIGAATGSGGGSVTLTGGRVGLTDNAVVDVSGASGGGNVTVAATDAITVTKNATIKASATVKGDGGGISVKAGKVTQFAGSATVAGGPQGGDGGKAEISGASLNFTGAVDRAAPLGKAGTLLFDPTDITIVSGDAAAPSDITGGLWGFAQDSGAGQTISVGAIEALLSGGDLELQATNSLTVAAPTGTSFTTIASTTANALTLTAPTIAVNGSVSLPNGTLVFNWPDADATTFGTSADSVTSASTAIITAHTLRIAGNYNSVALSGPVTTSSLQFTQPDFSTSITINNAANDIAAVSLDPGGTNSAQAFDIESASALTMSGNVSIPGASTARLVAGGDLTLASGFQLAVRFEAVLASTGGVIDNLAGSSAVTVANARVLLYSATDGIGPSGVAFNDGGLSGTNFQTFSGVAYPSDPDVFNNFVEYFVTTSAQPTLTITADSFTRTYLQADPTFTASYAGGSGGGAGELSTLPLFRIAQGSDINAGVYTIEPYGAASAADLLRYVDGTLTVNPAVLIISANSPSMTYGGAVPAFTTNISGFLGADTAALVSGVTVNSTAGATPAAGNYAVTPSGATVATPPGGSEPNYTVSYQPGVFTVNPAPLTVSAVAYRTIYGAAIGDPQLTFSGFVNGTDAANDPAVFAPFVSVTKGPGVGSYPITLDPGADSNYSVTYIGADLTITPAPLIITPNFSKVYGAALFGTLPATDFSGFVAGDTPASLTTQPSLATTGVHLGNYDVGSYAMTASGAVDANYAISYAPGTLNITPAPLLISANSAARRYGAADPAFTVSYSGFVNGDTAAAVTDLGVATTATATSNIGFYTITPFGASARNYAISYANGPLTVSQALLLITANDATRQYGAANPAFTVSYSGFVNGDTAAAVPGLGVVTAATAATATSNVGAYAITPLGASLGTSLGNYVIGSANGVLTVTPAPLSITPSGTSFVGSDPAKTATVSYDAVGFVANDTLASLTTQPSFNTAATASSGLGAYALTASGAVDPNYTITYLPGELQIMASSASELAPGSTNISTITTPSVALPDSTVTLSTLETIETPTLTPAPAPIKVKIDADAIYGPALGGFGPEAGPIIDQFLATMTDSTPPITWQQVVASLNDPATSAATMGLLMPFVYTDLANILDLPQSSWTQEQSDFVASVQAYIEAQRQAAAAQAEAGYQAWAISTAANAQAQLNAVSGVGQIYMSGIMSGTPPVPPDDFLNEVQGGMTMNLDQATTVAGINGQVAALADSEKGVQAGTSAFYLGGVGFKVAVGANRLSIAAKLAPKLVKAIFPNAITTATRTSRAANVTTKVGESAVEVAEDSAKIVAASGEVLGAVGAVLEVVGTIVQTGIAADLYNKQADYNAAFQTAVNAANQPVSVADLKNMMATDDGAQQMFGYLTASMATGGISGVTDPNAYNVTQPMSLQTMFSLANTL